MEMYLGKGFYSFAKSKMLKAGDKLHCTYIHEEKNASQVAQKREIEGHFKLINA